MLDAKGIKTEMRKLYKINFYFGSLIILAVTVLMLGGCARKIPTKIIAEAARQVVSDLEKSLAVDQPEPVLAIGFTDDNKDSSSVTQLLEERLNHYLTLSDKFKVLENEKDKVVEFMKDQTQAFYDQDRVVSFGKFTPLKYVITGSLRQADDTVEIQAKLISIENAMIIDSSLVTLSLGRSPLQLVLIVLLSLVAFGVILSVIKGLFKKKTFVDVDPFSEMKCGSCGKRIRTPNQIGGECSNPPCEVPICNDCWNINKERTCKVCSSNKN